MEMHASFVLLLVGFYVYCIRSIQSNNNIAFRKPTKQSTTHEKWIGGSSAAVDGYLYPAWSVYAPADDFMCTHTRVDDSTPWWAVYLGGLYSVSKIKVYMRNDCCLHMGSKMTIEVIRPKKCSCDKWEPVETGFDTRCPYQEDGVDFLEIYCPSHTIGSLVKIRRIGYDGLSLCEVHGYGNLIPSTTDNVYSACGLQDMMYTGPITMTTTARSNVECVVKCITSGSTCRVVTYNKDTNLCHYTSHNCSEDTVSRQSNPTSNSYLIN